MNTRTINIYAAIDPIYINRWNEGTGSINEIQQNILLHPTDKNIACDGFIRIPIEPVMIGLPAVHEYNFPEACGLDAVLERKRLEFLAETRKLRALYGGVPVADTDNVAFQGLDDSDT